MDGIKVKFFGEPYPIEFTEKGNWVDLQCSKDVLLSHLESAYIPLGVAIQLPPGTEAILAPRSSTFKKYRIIQTNGIGVIDESYCGDNDEWKMPVISFGGYGSHIPKGARIAQFKIVDRQPARLVEVVEHLTGPDRGGFGSTGV